LIDFPEVMFVIGALFAVLHSIWSVVVQEVVGGDEMAMLVKVGVDCCDDRQKWCK
jgi:hypothetical protein